MENLLNKISSYNIVNYVLPGVVFSVVIIESTTVSFPIKDGRLFENMIVYYFLGMIISRVGSLIVAPLLKKIIEFPFARYEDYIKAEKLDDKISILLEEKNTYRTMIACFVLILIFLVLAYICGEAKKPAVYLYGSSTVILIILFCKAAKKQTKFIVDRVNNTIKSERERHL